MGIGRWFSRRIGTYSVDLSVADEVIRMLLEKPRTQKFLSETNYDYKMLDEVMMKTVEVYKITDPQYYEAFIEKWEEYKQRIYKEEFDKKRDKYT